MLDENKIILTDIDDVLWYFVEAWIKWLNEKHGLNIKVEDCNNWDIHILYPMLSYEQIFEPLFLSEFWERVVPREDAIEYVPKLQEAGYTIKFCSASHFRSAAPKLNALMRYFPTVRDEDIILCEDKPLIKGKYLIDDKWQNLENRECPILMTSWHNREFKLKSNMIRVNNWEQIYNYITNKE